MRTLALGLVIALAACASACAPEAPAPQAPEAPQAPVLSSLDPAALDAFVAATVRRVLEDTSENGAIWTVERIRRQLLGAQAGVTLWAGVACYPAHAFDSDEILAQTEQALKAAREWRQDRIEVAIAP